MARSDLNTAHSWTESAAGPDPAASDGLPPVEPGRLDAFISYDSPSDAPFVDRLIEHLGHRGKSVWGARHTLEEAMARRARIARGIESAKALIFVVSPGSIGSVDCRHELDTALDCHTRVVPVVHQDVDPGAVPEPLARLDWIHLRETDDPVQALDRVVAALESDLEWRAFHARLGVRANNWFSAGQSPGFLLRGRNLRRAEQWCAQRDRHQEQPTPGQLAYVAAGRKASARRRRRILTGLAVGLVCALGFGFVALHPVSATGTGLTMDTRGSGPIAGGTGTTHTPVTSIGAPAPPAVGNGAATGYWEVGADGGIFSFGAAPFYGSAGTLVNAPVVGMAPTPDGAGYWLVDADGGVFAFGDARFEGSMGGQSLNQPIVAMAATPDGNGYWLVARDGGLFAFGDAQFHGSMGGQLLDQPVVGISVDPATGGYWEVGRDGRVFAFDAPFLGSPASLGLEHPVVAMAATRDGRGYWLATSDGGVLAYGTAPFYGSMGGQPLSQPIVGMAARPSGTGYWLVAEDGGLFSYGSSRYYGSMGGQPLAAPVVGMG